MGKSLVVDMNGTFGFLLRGLLHGEGHDASLAETESEVRSNLRLRHYDAAFLGQVPEEVLECLAAIDGLRLVQIGNNIGLEQFCDEILERPLRLKRLSELAGKLLVTSQRRRHRRHSVDLPGWAVAGTTRFEGQITDLALGGCRLALAMDPADVSLQVGQPVKTQLGLAGEPIGISTRVIYSRPTADGLHVGLGFEQLNHPVAGRLEDYLLCA